jgi:hypothetical protein
MPGSNNTGSGVVKELDSESRPIFHVTRPQTALFDFTLYSGPCLHG